MKKLFSRIVCFAIIMLFTSNLTIISLFASPPAPKKAISYIASDGTYHYYYGNDPVLLKIPENAQRTDGSDLSSISKLVVPENVKMIGSIRSSSLKELNISSADINIHYHNYIDEIFILPNLEKFVTDKSNRNFTAKKGILYMKTSHPYSINKKGVQLAAYPTNKKGSYLKIDDTVQAIGEFAFSNNKHLKKLVFSANIKHIGFGAFTGCKQLYTVEVTGKNQINNLFNSNDGYSYEGAYYTTFSGCSKLRIITVNNNKSGFELNAVSGSEKRSSLISAYKKSYRNILFRVKQGSQALKDIKEIGLRYRII